MAGIKHKVTKVSGEKGLASEWNDDHEQTGNHDVEQHQFLNQVIENRTDFPAGPVEGQIIYRTDLNKLYIYDGADWTDYDPAIKHGTHYLSINPTAFTNYNPASKNVNQGTSFYHCVDDNITASAPVNLPHGAVVTACIVYGNDPGAVDETWQLQRVDHVGGTLQMATANINTEDNTITNPTIDNENYSYGIITSSLDSGNRINGARITYTL